MRRATLVFLLFIVLVAAILALSQFLQSQPAFDVQIAVSPLAFDWASAGIERYNLTNPVAGTRRIRFVPLAVDDVAVWEASVNWTAASHPAAWIPAWSGSVTYASGLPFAAVEPSLARTVLMWGVFNSRAEALYDNTTPFGWDAVAAAAAAGSWAAAAPESGVTGSVITAFNRPTTTLSGMAVLFSAAADYSSAPRITTDVLVSADFRLWLQPVLESVPNFNTLGASPAMTIAARGAAVGQIALLPESDWLRNLTGTLVTANDPVRFYYPEHPFLFDFPLMVWASPSADGAVTAADVRSAVTALGAVLLSPAEQTNAQAFGLRPVSGTPTGAAFSAGEIYGVQASLPLDMPITPPPLNDLRRLLTWADNVLR
ncbi:MAG: hypothetical protein SF162_10410 [bacterium]|nr:hypothetical protein [bacterium]